MNWKKMAVAGFLLLQVINFGAAADLNNLTETEPLYDTENPDGYGDLVIGYTNDASGGVWAHAIIAVMFAVPMGSFLAKGFDTRVSFLTSSFLAWLVGGLLWAGDYVGDYALSFVTIMLLIGIGLAYAGGRKL